MNALPQHGIDARKMSALGWALILIAFVVPLASAAMGHINAGQAGYQMGQMAMALVVLILVTSLALRGRSAILQSYGRLAIGVLLSLWALGAAAQQFAQRNAERAFLLEAQKMQAAQAARFVELGKRFDAVDLGTVLTPEAVTSEARIAAGRETISKYRDLLAERKALLMTTFAESEHFFNTRSPTEADKREALASMERGKAATIKVYADLDTAQAAVANSMSDVLDWAARQKGKLRVENAQLVFANPQQKIELQELLAKLQATEARQQQALQAAAASQQKAQASMRESNERLEQLLK